jgi:hypothetical protein
MLVPIRNPEAAMLTLSVKILPMDDQLFQDEEVMSPQEASVAEQPTEANGHSRPTPHLDKLIELKTNDKLPPGDLPRVEAAVSKYREWIKAMERISSSGNTKVKDLVEELNRYKRYIELDLIWDSPNEFLFRQRGQHKVDNSIMEEFLPWLVDDEIISELRGLSYFAGPRKAFAAASFVTRITDDTSTGLMIRTKDQDFTISRPAYIKASLDSGFPEAHTASHSVNLAYLAAECKTNLDKTMFQEATATAHDLKVAIPGAKYYLVCEYLDMTPISTAGTDIDEVLILRGRRMGAQLRRNNSNPTYRKQTRQAFSDYLNSNPVRVEVIQRFVDHIRALFKPMDLEEDDVLAKGFF